MCAFGDVSDLKTGWYGLHVSGALLHVDVGLALVPVDDMVAVAEEAESLGTPDRAGMDRCIKCGPAKSGSPNAMLLVGGKCPRCGWEA